VAPCLTELLASVKESFLKADANVSMVELYKARKKNGRDFLFIAMLRRCGFHLISSFFPEKTPRETFAGNRYFGVDCCPQVAAAHR